MTRCPECGACYETDDDSCTGRFNQLLAFDHSRQEPWGSRHGQAFAAFALQHPERFAGSLDHAWAALRRIYVTGDRPSLVFDQLRSRPREVLAEWNVPPRSLLPITAPSVTIADLGAFDAGSYAERLDEWCRAAIAMWDGSTARTNSTEASA
jgi:hypothetical protein